MVVLVRESWWSVKVEDLLDFVCKVAWTALIGACAAYATVAFVRFLKTEPRPVVPERIEVVIVGQDKETPKPDHQRIGQKIGIGVVGNAAGGSAE